MGNRQGALHALETCYFEYGQSTFNRVEDGISDSDAEKPSRSGEWRLDFSFVLLALGVI